MQSRETSNSSKTSQNHTSAPVPNPFQTRLFESDPSKKPKPENVAPEQVEEASQFFKI
ncbi:hypothetical protein [Anabaena sp. UHCC 0253]|uniref:hypothetical protein n=1 Tax=Anabaena sp. UHCC 0253 TaxID=2590019 RepID=UPI0014471C99|nr:hypothetical protein [Anabaena sp. UHCC 0253]